MNVLIIGKSGQLANELISQKPTNIEHLCLGRDDVNVCDITSLENSVNAFKPSVIINASAYTAVDKAETDSDAAYLLNKQAVENLAIIAKKSNVRLLHVSTDFVFDGKKNKAYNVDDKTNPCSVYGASKLAGEQAITTHSPENSAIVRTSWLYSSHGNNFVKTMLRLMQEKEELSVVCDQIGCPTYAEGLAKFLWQLATIESVNTVYHWSDYGVASWYDFAVAIQEIAFDNKLLAKKIPIKPLPASSYPTPAARPSFSLLNASDAYLIEPSKHWTSHLTECIKKLNL